jgi:vacuolar-type H+-ATPase subunit I/STV1
MVNIIFGANIFLGIYCLIFGMIVYCIRYVKPELSRDEDIIFATICLLYGSILIFHGWRLDPILIFSQALIITIMSAAQWENIRLRGFIDN